MYELNSSKLVEMRSQLTQPVWFNHSDVPHVILVCLDNIIKHHPKEKNNNPQKLIKLKRIGMKLYDRHLL